jgi:hypothetical protein
MAGNDNTGIAGDHGPGNDLDAANSYRRAWR